MTIMVQCFKTLRSFTVLTMWNSFWYEIYVKHSNLFAEKNSTHKHFFVQDQIAQNSVLRIAINCDGHNSSNSKIFCHLIWVRPQFSEDVNCSIAWFGTMQKPLFKQR